MSRDLRLFPKGPIIMPPSKSVSHRALICAGLAEGTSTIHNIALSEDIRATLGCLEALGARYTDGEVLTVTGGLSGGLSCGLSGGLSGGLPVLDAGESGSTLRFLIPAAALRENPVCFTGRGRLLSRPMEPYRLALAGHGASLSAQDGALTVRGPLQPGVFTLPGDVSSQFVSGLLFALPLLNGDSEIRVTTPLQSAPYVDLTLAVTERFGIHIDHESFCHFKIRGGQHYTPQTYTAEADYSQAAFFLVAGALGCDCECRGLSPDSRQGDRRIVDILTKSGADVRFTPSGGVKATAGRLTAQTVDVSDIPDLVPPLAALFTFCEGTSRLTNAARLRHKESDRLRSVCAELTKLGADIAEQADGLVIRGGASIRGGEADSWHDHRIAMMLAVAAFRAEEPVRLTGDACVAKSYPDFWADFEKVPRKQEGLA